MRDDNFRVDGTVTKITKKRFQINNKSNSKKPLNWSILREPPLALRVLDKLEDEYKHVLQQYKDKKKECDTIYRNAIAGKTSLEGGLDNAQISAIFGLYEPNIRLKLKIHIHLVKNKIL